MNERFAIFAVARLEIVTSATPAVRTGGGLHVGHLGRFRIRCERALAVEVPNLRAGLLFEPDLNVFRPVSDLPSDLQITGACAVLPCVIDPGNGFANPFRNFG